MRSEPVTASRAATRGRRRKRGIAPAEGPVFVDSTGRRARLLRRLGLLVGAVCVGYTAVLGLAFMGVGISVNPSSLLPFGVGGGGGPEGGPGPGGGTRPQGGVAPTGVPPSPAPSASPSAVPGTAPATASSAAPSTAPTD
ncbi:MULTISPECIES: hypothetical protein [Streptomyces]|uniref:Membrane protein n=3 Tax=Streptomyces TaxID=1883 RepID=Q9XAP5_STRCO|nr:MULTISPECIES: hypothetical protein [Streptomyces]BDE41192.1 hypothetical protein SLITK23_44370 [Streptomyces lividans]EFD67470.1 predicted protein [Streptomyces lividans TK24]KKD14684.1 membrane protein [Streptomyces sp. WM6391]MBQ0951140.1 hypothetical protein [Streptomyces sp. RK76]MDX2925662.1 hypothetical protein [Streptomyces sp. NRRL_B-16638]